VDPAAADIPMKSIEKDASPPNERGAGRPWIYVAGVGPSSADHPWLQEGYYWSTPKSALFLGAMIILGLLLAELLALFIEL
jgi:hypothetical protein